MLRKTSGNRPIGGSFNQGSRRSALSGSHDALKAKVAEGYCEGVCLDWLRRVLLGGKTAFDVSDIKKGDGPARTPEQKTKSQVLRQAEGWDKRFGAEKDAFKTSETQEYNAVKNPLKKEWESLEEAHNKAHELYEKLVDDYNLIRNTSAGAAAKERHENAEAAWRKVEKQRDDALAKLDAATKANNDRIAIPELQRYWTAYAKSMDDFESLQRTAAKRTATKRPFSSLKVMASINQSEFSVGDYISKVLEHPEFKPTFGALLGVLPYGGGTGHALALHKLNTGSSYHLFDPNYGIFEMAQAQVVDAIKFLVSNTYNYAGPNGKIKADFSIFGHDRETPRPVPVLLKPEPVLGLPALIAKVEAKPPAQAPKPEPKPEALASPPPSKAPKPQGVTGLRNLWEQRQGGSGTTTPVKK